MDDNLNREEKMSEEQKTKDLCKTCEYYWEDFPLPLEYVVSHCDKIDEKYGLSKNMDNFVPYPCVECPFDSYKKAQQRL